MVSRGNRIFLYPGYNKLSLSTAMEMLWGYLVFGIGNF
jgi:hypothetical protein